MTERSGTGKSLLRRLMGKVTGGCDLSRVSSAEAGVIRPMNDLFRILVRRTPSVGSLAHCEAVYCQLPGPRPGDRRFLTALRGALLLAIAARYTQIGEKDSAARVEARARRDAAWPGPGSRRSQAPWAYCLQACLNLTSYPTADFRNVSPVVWALMFEWRRGGGVVGEFVVTSVDTARNSAAAPSLGPAIVEFARDTRTDALEDAMVACILPATFTAGATRIAFVWNAMFLALSVLDSEPDNKTARDVYRQSNRWLARRLAPGAPHGQSFMDSVREGQLGSGEQLTRMPEATTEIAAAANLLTALSEITEGGGPSSIPDLDRAVHRLRTIHIQRCRRVLPVPEYLSHLIRKAFALCEAGVPAQVHTLTIMDLEAECRVGGFITPDVPARPAHELDRAYLDLEFVDSMEPDLDLVPALAEAAADTFVLWINGYEPGVYFAVGLDTDTRETRAVQVRLPAAPDESSGTAWPRQSRDLQLHHGEREDAQHLAALRDLLPAAAASKSRLIVVPNGLAWELPWLRIAPDGVPEVMVTPSAGAYLRRTRRRQRPISPQAANRRRIIGLFHEELPGARHELATLEHLRAEGLVDFQRAADFAQLREALESQTFDMLTVAAHGSSGDGFEHRLLLPGTQVAPAAILGLRLPPTVLLGTCWSGRATESPDAVSTLVGCVANGARIAVGGLRPIDDDMVGRAFAQSYVAYSSGEPLTVALRTQYLRGGDELRRAMDNLTIVGVADAETRR